MIYAFRLTFNGAEMFWRIPILLAAAFVNLAAAGVKSRSSEPKVRVVDADLAFEGVSVVPMNSPNVLKRQDVLVKDGVIVALAPAGQIEPDEDAIMVDGTGKFLIPGLADMHVHAFAEAVLPLYVANGVTLVRNMWGEPLTLAMRRRVAAGEILGPRIVTAGRLVDGDPPRWGDASAVATTPEQARALMDRQKSEGFDFFKIYDGINLETFDAIAAYSKEIDFPFAGHVPHAVPLDHALRSGMATIEHLTGWSEATRVPEGPLKPRAESADRAAVLASRAEIAAAKRIRAGVLEWNAVFDPDRRREVAELAAEKGTWNVPTLAVNRRIYTSRRQAKAEFARPEMRYVAPDFRASWNPSTDFRLKGLSDDDLEVMQVYFDEFLRRVRDLAEAGAPLLTGTDAPNPFVVPGFAIHEELALLVEAGLSPYDALVAATREPARLLGELRESGTVEVGKRADLVLLNGNPLEDIASTKKIAGVVLAGRWLSKAEIDGALEEVADRYTIPQDWFERAAPLDSESATIEYSWHYNDIEFGAERLGTVEGEGPGTIVAQRRVKYEGDLTTESMQYERDATGSLTRLVYNQTALSGAAEGQATREDSILSLFGRSLDGTEVSQSIVLADSTFVVCDLVACLSPIIEALGGLKIGASRELDVYALESFGGLRFERETWTLSRADDEEEARVYEGVVKRGSEESTVRLVVDRVGLKTLRIVGLMGIDEVIRSAQPAAAQQDDAPDGTTRRR